MTLPIWVKGIKPGKHRYAESCAESDLIKALAVAIEALEKITKQPVESTEWHEYLCLKGVFNTAKSALAEIERMGEGK